MTSRELARLACSLPDLPQWVETRGLLLSGRCDVSGLAAGERDFIVRGLDVPLVCVVGRPDPGAIRDAVSLASARAEVIAAWNAAGHVRQALPGWACEPATIHALPAGALRAPASPWEDVRAISQIAAPSLNHLTGALQEEIERAVTSCPTAAAFSGGIPVSFCYAGARTETLWDVSIETLEPYRRRGLAASCVVFMIRRMRATGQEPVWGALDANAASLALAARLGFAPVARLAVVSRGAPP